jgi:nitrite reductase (NADH) large subunit
LWLPAKAQGGVAGLAAAGMPGVFAGDPPSARLKVLGIDLFSIGQFTPGESADVLLVDKTESAYASFLFRSGVLVGSILLGDASLAAPVKSAADAHQDFSAELARGISAAAFKELLKA